MHTAYQLYTCSQRITRTDLFLMKLYQRKTTRREKIVISLSLSQAVRYPSGTYKIQSANFAGKRRPTIGNQNQIHRFKERESQVSAKREVCTSRRSHHVAQLGRRRGIVAVVAAVARSEVFSCALMGQLTA